MDDKVIGALIGFGGIIFGIVARDLLLPIWSERRVKRNEAKRIYVNYAQPLAQSVTSLFWRLNEILNSQYKYFHPDAPASPFNNYKQLSTCFRLAVVLAWVRAIDREIASLPTSKEPLSHDVSAAIEKVRKVLADGHEIEVEVLSRVLALWGVRHQIPAAEKSALATECDRHIFKFLTDEKLEQRALIRGLSKEKKFELLKCLSMCISGKTREEVSDSVINETLARASEAVSITEGLIYRDWQDAIGDSALIKDDVSVRRYRSIGFAEYEEIAQGADNVKHKWHKRTLALFSGLDIDNITSDMRVRQLKELLHAVAGLLVCLKRHTPEGVAELIDRKTAEKACGLVRTNI